jgi:hypothetical protein
MDQQPRRRERFFGVIRRRDREVVVLSRDVAYAATAAVRLSTQEDHYVRRCEIEVAFVAPTWEPEGQV